MKDSYIGSFMIRILFDMKFKVLAVLLFCYFNVCSQSLCRTDIMNGEKVISGNKLAKFQHYDFSGVWLKTENSLVYGVIGVDNQRILIKILEVKKVDKHPLEYLVKGKSSVKGNVCDFSGKIIVVQIQESVRSKFGVDNEFEGRSKTQGLLTARYEFFENKNQKHAGLFKGKLQSKWYLDKNDQVQYDDINAHSDGFFNNAFVGNWQMYNSKLTKKCNWGDYRVPNIDCDFDIGVGEFSVSEKYWSKGWKDIARKN